jgi:phage-related minor tail protein
MSSQLGEAFVPIRATFDQFDKDLEGSRGKLEGVLGKFGGKLGAAVAGGLAIAAAAILALGAAVFDVARDYQQATQQIEARTGATGAELEALGQSVKNVFGDNWGESMGDAADAIIQVNQVLGETGEQMEGSARRALIFRDVFEVEINESLRAVRSGVESFGVSSETVFDQMTKTIQEVGDPAQDLADTVNEYAGIFAQAGFSAEEMFGILAAGVGEGARNFDVIADAVKEFTIRIIDGSDTTEAALGALFATVGDGSLQFRNVAGNIAELNGILDENEARLGSLEGAWQAQKSAVEDLEGAYSDARRELDRLTNPPLAGMNEFNDAIFELEQQLKKAELDKLQAINEVQADQAAEQVGELNKAIKELELQRDLKFDQQFHDLGVAARPAQEEVWSFEAALAAVNRQVDKTLDLDQSLGQAKIAFAELDEPVQALIGDNERLNEVIGQLQEELGELGAPAQELLNGLADGTISSRDAMSQVLGLLGQVDDKIMQNQIGVALFGTKWEDLGPQVMLALDPATNALADFEGATDAAGEAVSNDAFSNFQGLWRNILLTLLPAGESLLDIANEKMPEIVSAFEEGLPAFQKFLDLAMPEVAEHLGEAFGLVGENLGKINTVAAKTIELFGGIDTEASDFSITAEAFKAVVGALLDPWIKLNQVMGFMLENASNALDELQELKRAIVGLGDSTQTWIDRLGDLASALADMALPDWLTPGSPTPLETGIRGITAALEQLPDFASKFEADLPSLPSTVGVTSGGDRVTNVNVGSVSATSAGGNPVDEALRLTVGLLREQLRNYQP